MQKKKKKKIVYRPFRLEKRVHGSRVKLRENSFLDYPACPPITDSFLYPVSSNSLLSRSNPKLNTSPSNPITHHIKSPFLMLPFSFKSALWRLNPSPSIHHLDLRHCSYYHHQGIPQTREVFILDPHHLQCPKV